MPPMRRAGGTPVPLAIVQAMTSSDQLLDLIQATPEIDRLLRSSFDFDIARKQNGDGFRLASGAPMEVIAGESTGGAFFLCAEQNGRRPVVFASSEGEGGLLADDLGGGVGDRRWVGVARLPLVLWRRRSGGHADLRSTP